MQFPPGIAKQLKELGNPSAALHGHGKKAVAAMPMRQQGIGVSELQTGNALSRQMSPADKAL